MSETLDPQRPVPQRLRGKQVREATDRYSDALAANEAAEAAGDTPPYGQPAVTLLHGVVVDFVTQALADDPADRKR